MKGASHLEGLLMCARTTRSKAFVKAACGGSSLHTNMNTRKQLARAEERVASMHRVNVNSTCAIPISTVLTSRSQIRALRSEAPLHPFFSKRE